MPNYEYRCLKCQTETAQFTSIQCRDELLCEECGNRLERVFATAPQVRTEKLSRTFLDGHERPGMRDLQKAHELDLKALKFRPDSDKYKELTKEANEYRKVRQPGKAKNAERTE